MKETETIKNPLSDKEQLEILRKRASSLYEETQHLKTATDAQRQEFTDVRAEIMTVLNRIIPKGASH